MSVIELMVASGTITQFCETFGYLFGLDSELTDNILWF